MALSLLRIFSDLHYGDRASTLPSLESLLPLFDGADEIVFNGDTIDTRSGGNADHTAALLDETRRFLAQHPRVTLLTGNHDPDFGERHFVELAGGRLLVTHGDAFFEDLVPWSQDAPRARALIAAELAQLSPAARDDLHAALGAYRRAAAALPQRHQSEPHGLKYLVSLACDVGWPPTRVLRVLRAWREAPQRAARFAQRFRPHARFIAMGHTHRRGATRTASGLVVLNTGSFAAPASAAVLDVTADRIALRPVARKGASYELRAPIAEFSLAEISTRAITPRHEH